ncbi:hypothetical protein BCR32DRAFT_269702 [Anaeromyces robustus]|uniref:EGF-like domain-containing protein n=1 Tax=Anaeromyces robustus TaxID=1754192 RepID=A0A1Y1X070_9FUNG|nr:hypothetical protein BCR32DRAFT_269702 [Anaeromyces robustus]|eukprot:ORX79035.1 hypothetical protein BCR32DRAFT_269702 [Anaeromyces robustus]
MNINNAYIYDNENINKYKCGTISNSYNIKLIINNSTFTNNEVKNNGGSLCFVNIDNLDLKITSSVFEYNKASYGGAISFCNKIYNKQNKIYYNNIEITDTKFIRNEADIFGGAIYSDFYDLNITYTKKLIFTENSAYVGGGLYSNSDNSLITNNNNKNKKEIKYNNNKSYSHGNDYATNPYNTKISKKTKNIAVKSGELMPFYFELIDKFNQVIIDESKYYSDFILTIYPDDISEDIEIEGNSCNFSKGKCELNNFKIFSEKPISINVIASIENNKINFKNEELKIDIVDCNDNQIKLYNEKRFYYCQDPICDVTCPVSEGKAMCKKGDFDKNQNTYLNQCVCIPGWTGKQCEFKVYAKICFKYIRIATSPIIIIILIIMLMISFYKRKRIISDIGYVKCELIFFGILSYFE